jgi:hypothetical protein
VLLTVKRVHINSSSAKAAELAVVDSNLFGLTVLYSYIP